MKCKICGADAKLAFNHDILNKYSSSYYKCDNCGYLFTEEPYWLEESYSSAIASADTGIIDRNIYFAEIVPVILYLLGIDVTESKFVDYAGGGGIFVRMMRDLGLDYYWYDKYCNNWVSNGFEADMSLHYDGLTMFECLEHLPNPLESVSELSRLSDVLIFSTELLPSEVPDQSWWYYSFETGQHIGFFSEKTLYYLANELKYHYFSIGSIHVFSRNKIGWWRIKLLTYLLNKNRLMLMFSKFIKLSSKTHSDHILMKHKIGK